MSQVVGNVGPDSDESTNKVVWWMSGTVQAMGPYNTYAANLGWEQLITC